MNLRFCVSGHNMKDDIQKGVDDFDWKIKVCEEIRVSRKGRIFFFTFSICACVWTKWQKLAKIFLSGDNK